MKVKYNYSTCNNNVAFKMTTRVNMCGKQEKNLSNFYNDLDKLH